MNNNNESINREEDWFVFTVNHDKRESVVSSIYLSGAGGIDGVLSLFDSDLNEIARADNETEGGDESISGIGLSGRGKYYISVASKNYQSNNNNPYQLSFSIERGSDAVEIEKNDSIETANPIKNNIVTARINTPSDKDFFYFEPPGEIHWCRMELRTPPSSDAAFNIYDSKGIKIAGINNGGRDFREIYPDLYISGRVYIEVYYKNSRVIPDNYIFSVTPIEKNDFYEKEPNDNIESSELINSDEKVGFISYHGDRDFFLVLSNTLVKKTFTVKGVRGGEIRVLITDPLGHVLKTCSIKGDNTLAIAEIVELKAHMIIESVLDNYDYPYKIKVE
jgi:hypothetical protein